MSEWVKATGEVKKEFKEMEGALRGYSYREPKKAESTDKKFRRLVGEETGRCRDSLFPMIEAAYMDNDMDNAGPLEEVMQWLDIFILELGLPLVWDDKAGYKNFAKLIRSDVTLLRNSRKLSEILDRMQKEVLHGKGHSVIRKCAQLKKYISDLLTVFKRRRHALGG